MYTYIIYANFANITVINEMNILADLEIQNLYDDKNT